MIVVLGMHRSGTSALTGLLYQSGGLSCGAMVAAKPSNPKGHFEPVELVSLNKRILKTLRQSWGAQLFKAKELPPSLVEQQTAFLSQFRDSRALLKDPRLCLTYSVWRHLLPAHTIVVSVRHPASVARSLIARDGLPLEEGLKRWGQHNRAIVHHLKGRGEKFFMVNFAALRRSPVEVGSLILHHLGLEPQSDEALSSWLDVPSSLGAQELVVPPPLLLLWQKLVGLVPRGAGWVDASAL
jgi:hypothetical protein